MPDTTTTTTKITPPVMPIPLAPIPESDEDTYSNDDYNQVWYPSDQYNSCPEDFSLEYPKTQQFVAYMPRLVIKDPDGENEDGENMDANCWDEEMVTVIVADYPDSEEEEREERTSRKEALRRKRRLYKEEQKVEHEYDADREDGVAGDGDDDSLEDFLLDVQSNILLRTFWEMAREWQKQ
jgi:hypothetical protein